jgi:hypothetical protein
MRMTHGLLDFSVQHAGVRTCCAAVTAACSPSLREVTGDWRVISTEGESEEEGRHGREEEDMK